MRFGQENLHHCEVMIKDMIDSKRIDSRIHQDVENVNFKDRYFYLIMGMYLRFFLVISTYYTNFKIILAFY
jgi:hypothetical protein